MKRLLLTLLLCGCAYGNTPMFLGGTTNAATASKYYIVNGWYTYQNAEANAQLPAPSAGTLKGLTVWVSQAPGAGQSWTVMVRLNGGNTLMTIAVENSATSATYTGDIDIAADDLLAIYLTASGGQAAAVVYWAITYDTDTPHQQWITFRHANLNTSSTGYAPLVGVHTGGAASSYTIFPTAGTLSNLHVKLSAAPGADKARFFDTNVGGSTASALDKTAGAADTVIADDVNSVSVSAGNGVIINSTVTGTPAASAANFSMVFTPTDTDHWALLTSSYSTTLNTGSTTYACPVGFVGSGGTTTTEATWQMVVPAIKIINQYVALSGAAGDGKSYTFTLRDDGQDTALASAISGAAATSASDTGSITVAAGSLLATSIAPASTPTARYISGISYTVDDGVAAESTWNSHAGMLQGHNRRRQ